MSLPQQTDLIQSLKAEGFGNGICPRGLTWEELAAIVSTEQFSLLGRTHDDLINYLASMAVVKQKYSSIGDMILIDRFKSASALQYDGKLQAVRNRYEEFSYFRLWKCLIFQFQA
jgi:hypothetical protein